MSSKNFKMRDNIIKRGKKWTYVIRIPDESDLNGKKSKNVWISGFSSREEAVAERDKKRVEVKSGKFVLSSNATLGEYLSHWLLEHQGIFAVRKYTARNYQQKINSYVLPYLGSKPIQKIRTIDIKNLYIRLLNTPTKKTSGLNASTVISVHAVLSKAFNDALISGLIAHNPMVGVKKPKNTYQTKFIEWNNKQLSDYLEIALKHRLGAAFRLLAFTGARRGEIVGIKWEDLNLNDETKGASPEPIFLTIKSSVKKIRNGEIVIDSPKNGSPRVVRLDEETVRILRAHRKQQNIERMKCGADWRNNGYVFTTNDGEMIHPDTLSSLHKEFVQKANVPTGRLHDLRHLHATTLLSAGVPMHEVAARLGHKDATTTAKVYAHVFSNEKAKDLSKIFADEVSVVL